MGGRRGRLHVTPETARRLFVATFALEAMIVNASAPIFVVEALCEAGAGIKGRCRGPRSCPSCSRGDVVEGARARGPLAADLSSEAPLRLILRRV